MFRLLLSSDLCVKVRGVCVCVCVGKGEGGERVIVGCCDPVEQTFLILRNFEIALCILGIPRLHKLRVHNLKIACTSTPDSE